MYNMTVACFDWFSRAVANPVKKVNIFTKNILKFKTLYIIDLPLYLVTKQ